MEKPHQGIPLIKTTQWLPVSPGPKPKTLQQAMRSHLIRPLLSSLTSPPVSLSLMSLSRTGLLAVFEHTSMRPFPEHCCVIRLEDLPPDGPMAPSRLVVSAPLSLPVKPYKAATTSLPGTILLPYFIRSPPYSIFPVSLLLDLHTLPLPLPHYSKSSGKGG